MRDFFGFSDEYKVKKKISVEKFLGSVNATEKERERLNHAIIDISIQYDIKCADNSELIIVAAEIMNCYEKRQGRSIAEAIASSIPYCVIVVLFFEQYSQIFAFETAVNSNNDRRRVVNHYASTYVFSSNNPEDYVKNALRTIRKTVFPASSASDMMLDWMNCFRNERKRNTIKEYRISEYLQSLLETTSSFLSYKELDTFGDEDDPENDILEEIINYRYSEDEVHELPDYDSVFAEKQFLSSLGCYAAILYDEYREMVEEKNEDKEDAYSESENEEELYSELEDEEEMFSEFEDEEPFSDEYSFKEWIDIYLVICNKIYYQLYGKSLEEPQLIRIFHSFAQDDIDESAMYYGIVDIDTVRMMLEEYYEGMF